MPSRRRPSFWLPFLLLPVLAGLLGMHVLAQGHGAAHEVRLMHDAASPAHSVVHAMGADDGGRPPAVVGSAAAPRTDQSGDGCCGASGYAGNCAAASCTPAPAHHVPAPGPPRENALTALLRAPETGGVTGSFRVRTGPSALELGISRT